jgi:polar amino acid transport system substrate-binding protein
MMDPMTRTPLLTRRRALAAAAAAAALALGLAGCATGSGSDGSGDGYLTSGKFTVATGNPAYPPYVIDDKPQSGQGFESAVAYAVADKLGFAKKDVVWVRTDFDKAIAPGPKDFDVNIQQYSITDQRKKRVDFSTPYYQAAQAVLTVTGSKAAGDDSLASLKGALLGVATGTTSLSLVEDQISPTQQPQVYNSNDDAVAALKSGQVDAIVVDLPTAIYLASAELDDGKILGQLPSSAKGGEEWGFLLAKDSPLTAKVSKAVDELRADGTLAALEKKWMNGDSGAAVLK